MWEKNKSKKIFILQVVSFCKIFKTVKTYQYKKKNYKVQWTITDEDWCLRGLKDMVLLNKILVFDFVTLFGILSQLRFTFYNYNHLLPFFYQ